MLDKQHVHIMYQDLLLGKYKNIESFRLPKDEQEIMAEEMVRFLIERILCWEPKMFAEHFTAGLLDKAYLSLFFQRGYFSYITGYMTINEKINAIVKKCYMTKRYAFVRSNIIETYLDYKKNGIRLNFEWFEGIEGIGNLRKLFWYFLTVYIFPLIDDAMCDFTDNLYKIFAEKVIVSKQLRTASLYYIFYNRFRSHLDTLYYLLPDKNEYYKWFDVPAYRSSSIYSYYKYSVFISTFTKSRKR